MIVTAVVLAICAALLDWFIEGIREPWRKLILAGIVIVFILGVINLIFPGILPITTRWY